MSTEQDCAVVAFGDPQPAVLDQPCLLRLVALAVSGVPVVVADVIELARRVLARLLQKWRFVELRAECIRRSRQGSGVRVPDLTLRDLLYALGHSPKVLADRDRVSSGVARHVAVES